MRQADLSDLSAHAVRFVSLVFELALRSTQSQAEHNLKHRPYIAPRIPSLWGADGSQVANRKFILKGNRIMRRNLTLNPLADQIRCHLHLNVTPRVSGYWNRMAKACSRRPDRYRFYHPDFDQFDIHMVDEVMEYLAACGYDPLLPLANHLKRAERLLWSFWKKNVHLERWACRITPLSLDQQLEEHGDTALEGALDLLDRPLADMDRYFDSNCEQRTFMALREEGWPKIKAEVVVMKVFEGYDYKTLAEYLQIVEAQAVLPATIRQWVSRDFKQVGRRILPRVLEWEPPPEDLRPDRRHKPRRSRHS